MAVKKVASTRSSSAKTKKTTPAKTKPSSVKSSASTKTKSSQGKTKQAISKKSSESVSKTQVILRGLDVTKVLLLHYGVSDDGEDDGITETVLDYDEYSINDLLHESGKTSKRSTMFFDPHKGQIKMWAIMADVTENGPLPRRTNKPCWWCRCKFHTSPIGCPVKYTAYGKSTSKTIIRWFEENNIPLKDRDGWFETEGTFCMFSCVKAYILNELSRTKSPKYKKSLTLLSLLYCKLMGELAVIPRSGTWKTTTEWGGHMSPQEYRASIGPLEYTETINVRRPYMFSTSQYIQERRLKDE